MNNRGKTFVQFIKFSLVGVLNTAISEGVYVVLLFFDCHYILASFIGFSLSVVNAYYWNNKYVFIADKDNEKRIWWKVFGKTYIAYLWGYFANAILLVLWMDIVKIERWMGRPYEWFVAKGLTRFDTDFLAGLLAAIINLIITVPMNYIINREWTFKQRGKGEQNE